MALYQIQEHPWPNNEYKGFDLIKILDTWSWSWPYNKGFTAAPKLSQLISNLNQKALQGI